MKNRGKLAIGLLLLCMLIAVIPLIAIKDSEFGGADGQAGEGIAEIAPDYEPWAASFIEPPGGETESLLFSLQSAFGAGILGLGFGYLIARSRFQKQA